MPATVDYGTLLGTASGWWSTTPSTIDTGARRILLALGRRAGLRLPDLRRGQHRRDTRHAVQGARRSRIRASVADLEGAQRLRNALFRLPSANAPITVVGAGLTGIEAASELAEQGRPVTLVCGGILGPSLSKRGRRSVGRATAQTGRHRAGIRCRQGVRWDCSGTDRRCGAAQRRHRVDGGALVCRIWQRAAAEHRRPRRLLTDETLTSIDDERIVAAGDAAARRASRCG